MSKHVPGLTLTTGLFLSLVLTQAFAGDAGASNGVNAEEHDGKPYVVLISIDGFGWDARDRADTPALDRLAAGGVVAKSMRPVWPTLTFPNHYAIATGLYPAEHGIVGNSFPGSMRDSWYALHDRDAVQEGSWYAGEPIWVSAEKAGMVAASYFFVGTEAPVQGIRPTHFYLFDDSVPPPRRVAQVLDWLRMPAKQRPHMITLYFEHVDEASHRYGPNAVQTRATITAIDGQIATLLEGIEDLPHASRVYVVVVSDHGQSLYVDPDNPFVLDRHVDIGDAGVVQGGNYVKLFYETPDEESIADLVGTVNARWCCGKAYARRDAPAHWRIADDDRYPDVILQADGGHAIVTDDGVRRRLSTGAHGWPPVADAMGATFIARGARLPAGVRIGEIHITDVYPMLLEILGLPYPSGYEPESTVLIDLLLPAAE